MKAVQFRSYGEASEVLEIAEAPIPEPGPTDLLVRVHASSVNSIDCAVRRGYGREFFESRGMSRWPIRPGRDLAGDIVAAGPQVTQFRPGEEIYATTLGGTNAEYALVPEAWAALKPPSLSMLEAASLPYSALTTWTALVSAAGLNESNGKRVIIARAAGGVGSLAVQLVKAWDGYVAALCSPRSYDFVRALGADEVRDYMEHGPDDHLQGFDIAMDGAFNTEQRLLDALKVNAGASYVSIVSPRLRLIDEHGLTRGLQLGDELLAQRVAAQRALGRGYYWVFTQPSGAALRVVAELVVSGKIRPIIDRVYPLKLIVEAHCYCESAKAHGKILLDLTAGLHTSPP